MNSSISTYSTITFAAPTIGAVSQSSFTGKETDWETGYSYFGARYYDPTLLTSWTAVDPMADKYPNISPYAYCNWNPIKITDPDGRDWYIPEGATEPIWQKDVTEDNLPQGARYIGSTAHWTGQTESDMDFRYHGDENGNITREDITYIITEKTTNTYDVNKAVTYLQQNALTKSIGKCARYTTNAINYGGGENVKRDDAYKMGPNLLAGGFYTVNVDFSQAQKGDVAVIQGFLRSQHPDVQLNKDHPWGHMQMFDGRQWISDFKQSGFWPGGDYKKVQPKYTIYRHY